MPSFLVCPACREVGNAQPLTSDPAGTSCARCGARYPRTVADVVADPLAPYLRGIAASHADPADATALAVVPFLPDDDSIARRLQRVSVSAIAHFGDLMTPAADPAWPSFSPFLDALPKGDVVELGCGAGRVAIELARRGSRVVALDSDPAVITLGARVCETGAVDVLVRRIGAHYERRTIRAPSLKGTPVEFALADATDPPLAAGAFDAVVALNLLDNVRVPSTLLGQADALLKPGGMLLLSTPYAWDSALVDDGERVGGAPGRRFGGAPETELRNLLQGRNIDVPWRFELVRDVPDVPWTLVRDDRCRFHYSMHVVLARKAA